MSLTLAIEPEKVHEISKSQLELWDLCPRRWAYKYLAKLPEPKNRFAEFGIAAHAAAENWLKHGTLLPVNSLAPQSQETKIALALQGGIPHMPAPSHPYLQVEHEFHYEYEGARFMGYMDATSPQAHPLFPNVPWPIICDWKFVGSLRYVPTVEELKVDKQSLIYSWEWFRQHENIEKVVLNWVYCQRGSRGAMPVVATVDREHVKKHLRVLAKTANILTAHRADKTLAPGDFSIENRREGACTAYGAPCPFLSECEKVGDNDPAAQIGDLGEGIMAIEGNTNGGLAGILATMPQNGAPARPLWAGQVPLATVPVATGVNPPPVESAPKAATPPPPPAPPAAPPAPPGASDGVPRGFIRVSIPGMAEPVTLPANMENNLPPGSAVVARGDAAPPIPATAPKGLPTNAVPPGEYVVAPKAGPATIVAQAGAPKRKGGRPPGSLNKTKIVTVRPPTGTPPGTPFEVSAPPGTKVVIQPAKEPTVKPGAVVQYVPIAEMGITAAVSGPQPGGYMAVAPTMKTDKANAFHLYINTLPTKAPGMTVVSATDLLSQVLPKLCREMNVAHYKAIDDGKSTAALASYTEAYLMQNPLGENVIVTVQTSTQEGSDVCATLERLALRVSRGTL